MNVNDNVNSALSQVDRRARAKAKLAEKTAKANGALAARVQSNQPVPGAFLQGVIDTSYQTQQKDMFTSGLAAQIGPAAFIVWSAIKSHADYNTGEAWPGVRRLMAMTGSANGTIQRALKTLVGAHLLRVRKQGQAHVYVARERLDVRVGSRVICTLVVDYIPNGMKDRLKALRAAAMSGDGDNSDAWVDVEVLPGPGFAWDPQSKSLAGKVQVAEVLNIDAPATGKTAPLLDF